MESKDFNKTDDPAAAAGSHFPATTDVTEVDVEPIGDEEDDYPVIPPERRLSWIGWTLAIAVFIINKKIGIVFFILLLVFGKFPTLNLKNLPAGAGRFFRKMRS
jgi:hypothetical protein